MVAQLPVFNMEKSKNLAGKARTSVSAEVFGRHNKKGLFVQTIIPKSDVIKEK
jgi:hypothetical protein